MKFSFIVPAYNEGENIGAVLDQLKENYGDQEVLVIDDASTDNTFAIAKDACPGRAFRHIKNQGYGATLKDGILRASGDFVVFIDGDGQHPIQEIQKVVNMLIEDPGIDAVITRRRNIYSSGVIRSIGKLLISFVVRRLTNEKIADLNSGLRAFKRMKILPFLFLLPDSFSFSTTTTVLAYKENFNLKWVDIMMDERKAGRSQVKLSHGTNTLLLIAKLIVIFDPLKFFLPITGYSFLLGILSVINSLIQTRTIGKNYIFFLLFGVLMFILGLLSEQISMLRKEISLMKNRNGR